MVAGGDNCPAWACLKVVDSRGGSCKCVMGGREVYFGEDWLQKNNPNSTLMKNPSLLMESK